jgi:predicted Rossmann fold flavoprotein
MVGVQAHALPVAARLSYRSLGAEARAARGFGVAFRARRRFAARPLVAAADAEFTDVAVLGGGAAGLTAAYFAAKAGARVTVYERNKETGKKILMSGGARCNVLPVSARVEDFVTESTPRLMKNVLASWNVERCREWLEDDLGLELGIEHVSNKYFPLSNSSKEVRDKLLRACEDAGVRMRYGASVEALRRVGGDGENLESGWALRLADAPEERAPVVVLAMGGLSFPAVGTDGTGYAIARRDLGHTLKEPYPALVPLTGEHPGGERMPGLSVDVSLECARPLDLGTGGKKKKKAKASREGFLFTHRGFSGPSVLDLSHNLVRPLARSKAGGFEVETKKSFGQEADTPLETAANETLPALIVNWSGESRDLWQTRLTEPPGRALVATRVKEELPARLAEALMSEAGVSPDTKVADLKKADRGALLDVLTKYAIEVSGHQGYRKAEVTGGGVALDDIDCSTMESKTARSVFFCGEVCDVFGRIGGFNFLWAWTSGRLAGMSAANRALSAER